MKRFGIILLVSLFSLPALATIDANTRVYIVVQDIQSGNFFLERAPIIGCFGLARGPQLAQFTSEYRVNEGMGCGATSTTVNINALVCARVLAAKESPDYTSFSEITLDISRCRYKGNARFITMVRTAAKLNFPLKRGEVKLTLVR